MKTILTVSLASAALLMSVAQADIGRPSRNGPDSGHLANWRAPAPTTNRGPGYEQSKPTKSYGDSGHMNKDSPSGIGRTDSNHEAPLSAPKPTTPR